MTAFRSFVLAVLPLALASSAKELSEPNLPPWLPDLPPVPTAPPDFRFPVSFDRETHDNVAEIAGAFRTFVLLMGLCTILAFLFVGYVLYELLRPRMGKARKGLV